MDVALDEYLRGLAPLARERVVWPFADFEADVASYLTLGACERAFLAAP